MKNMRYIRTMFLTLVCAGIITTSNICVDKVVAEPAPALTSVTLTPVAQNSATADSCPVVNALAIVNSPKTFLNKTVTINAHFDKFSTLGLDYKPAFKSSDDYISFLIKRDDTKYDIPLSELKLFLKRDEAEKFIDLKTNDEISITGTVFSDALGDAWVDVSKLVVTKKAPEKDGVK